MYAELMCVHPGLWVPDPNDKVVAEKYYDIIRVRDTNLMKTVSGGVTVSKMIMKNPHNPHTPMYETRHQGRMGVHVNVRARTPAFDAGEPAYVDKMTPEPKPKELITDLDTVSNATVKAYLHTW